MYESTEAGNNVVVGSSDRTPRGRISVTPFFRKYLRPEEVGSKIYELLRTCVESDGELSLDSLLFNLDLRREALHEHVEGDVMVGLMFSAILATERSTTPRTARKIIMGMTGEFLHHLEEQGADAVQCAEWETTIAAMFLSYRNSMDGYSGFEPPWKLGRQLYWNLVGNEVYAAMPIKIATLYLLAAREKVQSLLNECGPFILTGT